MSPRGRAFCLAASCLFLVRGVFFLSLFPLFEGWDEYQHVARIDFEAQHGRRPLIGEAAVPDPFLEQLLQYPHGVDQLRAVGALGFQQFWESVPVFVPPRGHFSMYEDQQAPLYYWLAAPLYRLAGGTSALLTTVTVLRVLNLLLGTLAVYVALRSLCRLLKPTFGPQLLLLVASLHPLFLQNVARVANDALAVVLGTAVIALALHPATPGSRWRGLGLGALLGAAVLAKATSLILVPFVSVAVVLQAPTRRRGAEAVVLVATAFVLVAGWEFLFNLRHYGTWIGLIEAIENHKQGRGLLDLLAVAPQVPWLWTLRSRCVEGSLWQGGWSFVELPGFLRTSYSAILAAGCAGWLLLGRRSNRNALIFTDPRTPLHVFVLGACALLGLAAFALQSRAAHRSFPVVAWYAMVIVPWVTALFHQGARLLPGRWPGIALPLALLLLYVGTELYGTLFVMVPHYTGHAGWQATWQRLSWLQTGALGPKTALLALVSYVALLAALMTVALRPQTSRQPDAP